jgi:hypothetical protein
MKWAHEAYIEAQEEEMDNRLKNPQGKRGSDELLMFKLKAEKPEKYREEVKVLNMDAPLKMLDKLAEMAARERAEREALEWGGVVGGEIREVEGKENK